MTAIMVPMIAMRPKDMRKLEACAMNPIKGGPNRKPRYPIVETAAMATPGDMILDLPAALYIIGTTDDTPAPTIRKPMVAVMNWGNKTDNSKPEAINKPLSCSIFFTPNLKATQSPTNLPVAIVDT